MLSATKKCILLSIIIFGFSPVSAFASDTIPASLFSKLENTHDLSLPDWGPYTKRYIGISHIPDVKKGIRFDLSVFPGYYRRKVAVPNVFFENEYHPWEAAPNYEYFSFRHELEWKDRVYTDISYSMIDETSRLIRIECVNNTDIKQNIALHYMASIHFPPIKEYSPYTPLYAGKITLPKGTIWIDALDYADMNFATPRPQDNLGYDGKMRGEIRADGFINGSGIGLGFGRDKGDNASYKIRLEKDIPNAVLYVRYKMQQDSDVTFNVSGLVNADMKFQGEKGFAVTQVKLGNVSAGTHVLTLTSAGGSAVELDGFTVIDAQQVDKIQITQTEWHPVPKIIKGPVDNSIVLKYEDIDLYYGIQWEFEMSEIRQWFCRDLDDFFNQMTHNHVQPIFKGDGDGHYTNIFLRPINIKPNSTRILYATVCYGSKDEVETQLRSARESKSTFEKTYIAARNHVIPLLSNGDGDPYIFSLKRMSATLSCNVVYPVYTQREYIRHSAPGRWWDCLYTWDSGFIGIGMLQLDTHRAIENLNAYVTKPGAQSAFIHHGTPVPVQQYLFHELWNKTQSKELLSYFYPRMKQYHEFMAGRLGSSTTRTLKSNLLRTWDYFYNSGGWDDYPPQEYIHTQGMEPIVTPVVNTAHAIRTAKILKLAAIQLGLKNDVNAYDKDIKMFSKALQKYSWDEESGYFSYVLHDDKGKPSKILKYQDEINYDMGLDGAYPLVAGICTPGQKTRLLGFLKSDKHIWSQVGLSAVDQSAPYFQKDGYWNGTVWMAHQWFYWKTMLDLGEADFAFKIADTALETWKLEVEASYNCMEHFIIETGRGAGWHEFGGLSAPVLAWYSAYYRPGNFTTGLNLWQQNKVFNENNSELSVDLMWSDNDSPTCSVVACMNPANQYSVIWNGKKVDVKLLSRSTLSINLSFGKAGKGHLEIHKISRK
jgi:hypothetical protein